MHRDAEIERGPFASLRLHPNTALVGFNQPPANYQAKAEPFDPRLCLLFQPLKRLEELRLAFRRDSNSLIANANI